MHSWKFVTKYFIRNFGENWNKFVKNVIIVEDLSHTNEEIKIQKSHMVVKKLHFVQWGIFSHLIQV